MADRYARLTLGNALRAFMQRQTRSYAFSKVVLPYTDAWLTGITSDPSVQGIAEALDSTYDDFRNENIRVPAEAWDALLRTLVFLQTDLEYTHENKKLREGWEAVRSFWPFASEQEWRDHAHLQNAEMPQYDASLMSPRKTVSLRRALARLVVMVAIGIGILGLALIALDWWLFRRH